MDTTGADPRYERNSSTLIVDTKYQSSDQLSYDVVSELPTPTAEQLQLAEQNRARRHGSLHGAAAGLQSTRAQPRR